MKKEKNDLVTWKRSKWLLKITLLSSLILFMFISGVRANSIAPGNLEDFFNKTLVTNMKEERIPNATVSVVAKGEVVFQKGYGYADLDKKVPVKAKTHLFRIGSTSKLFTWTAVMQLVEQGKLDLDADINNYLDFKLPAKIENSSNKQNITPITMRQLLTHTSGFEGVSDGLFYLSADKMLPLDEYLRTYLPARVFPAGEVMAYSNYGTALAGYIVEQVSGMLFSQYVEENIYTPLKMKDSSFQQPLPEDLSSNLVKPYRFVKEKYIAGDFEFMPTPAGGMSTTASDMAKFMIAHLQQGYFKGNRILKEKNIRKMHKQQFTQDQRLDGMTLGFMESTCNNRRILFHPGSTMIFDAGLYLLPQENVGVFISYSGSNHLIHAEIFQKFMDRYYSSLYSMNQNLQVDNNDQVNRFVGEYQPNNRNLTTSEKFFSLFMMNPIKIDVAEKEGYLLATYLGETNRFVEVESGVYHKLSEGRTQSPYGAFSKLIFDTDSSGRTMLMTDGPMTYSKAPWYATRQFVALAFGITLLIILGSLIIWGIEFIYFLFNKSEKYDSKTAIVGRLIAVSFSVLTLILIMGFGQVMQIKPVYGVPKLAFGIIPEWWNLLFDQLPILMFFSAVVTLMFTVLAWYKKIWGRFTRIHHSLFSIATMILMWLFYYWNVL